MRRMLVALISAVALSLVSVAGISAAAQAPAIKVTPVAGNQFRSFTLSGSGFAPGAALDVWWNSPDGEWLQAYQGDQVVSITTNDQGAFRLIVVPAVDFAGAKAGVWTAYVCLAGTNECWTAEFTINR